MHQSGIMLAAAAGFFFSFTPIIYREARDRNSMLFLNFMVMVVSLFFFVGTALARREPVIPVSAGLLVLAVVGGIAMAVNCYACILSLQYLPVAVVWPVLNLTPPLVALMALIYPAEGVSPVQVLGLACFCGALIFLSPRTDPKHGSPGRHSVYWMPILGLVSGAVNIYTLKLLNTPLVNGGCQESLFLALSSVFGTAAMIIFICRSPEKVDRHRRFISLAVLAGVSFSGGMILMMASFSRTTAAAGAAVSGGINLTLAPIWTYLLRNERAGRLTLVGIILAAASIWLISCGIP